MAPLPTKAVLLACVTSVSVWFRIFREAKTENPYLGLSLLRNRKEKLATQARVEQTLYKARVRTDEAQYNRSRTQWMYWWNSVERSIGFLYCYYKLRQKIQTTVMIRLSARPSRAHLLLVHQGKALIRDRALIWDKAHFFLRDNRIFKTKL